MHPDIQRSVGPAHESACLKADELALIGDDFAVQEYAAELLKDSTKGAGVSVNVSLSCAFGCPMEGDVPEAAVLDWCARYVDEMGADGIKRSDRKSAEPVTKEDARARIANLRAMLGNKPGTIG